MTRSKLLWPLVAGVVLFLVLHYWRGFYPAHALVVGVAGAALVYWSLRAAENLRRLR